MKALAQETINRLGGLDILINNAGAARTLLPGTATIPDEEWQDANGAQILRSRG